jgi:hypothetical protein
VSRECPFVYHCVSSSNVVNVVSLAQRSCVTCTHKMLRAVRAGCWWGNLYETDHLEDLGVDGRVLKLMYEKQDGRPSTALI